MKKWNQVRCNACGNTTIELSDVRIGEYVGPCNICHEGLLQRIASFSFARGWRPHWNTAVGGYVENKRQMEDSLKQLSDRESARLGTTQTYERVDMREKEALGVTDEGLDATRKRRREAGLDAPTRKIVI
mgnify:CR=1 FL=1